MKWPKENKERLYNGIRVIAGKEIKVPLRKNEYYVAQGEVENIHSIYIDGVKVFDINNQENA